MSSQPSAALQPRRDVAIVGMAGLFPQAPDLKAFWHNIVAGRDCITDPLPSSLVAQVYDPDSRESNRIACRRGGYLHELPPFVPARYGVMPRAVDGAEPEHFVALVVAHAALADAGLLDRPFNRAATEVILGRGTFVNRGFMSAMQHALVVDQTEDLLRDLDPDLAPETLARIRAALLAQLPPFSPETAPGLCHNVMAGLIANRLDLQGRTLVVDAACASALLALEIARDDLALGKCEVALVGGVQISTPAPIHMLFTQLGALSRSEHLKPFDRRADGTMLGEGAGMLVLTRLEDALAQGLRVYAVVKGVGSASDGKGAGLLAPRLEGEELALRRAYQDGGVDPATVGLIEAHGTGIPLGDRTEVMALRQVLGPRRGELPSVALGTVKSMIGHLIPAAGAAGMIKAALAIYHKVLPPTIACDEENPELELEKTGLYLNRRARPWIHGAAATPRRAGVNAFGFGGINAHVILEEGPAAADGAWRHGDWESEVLVVSAASRLDLAQRCQDLAQAWHEEPAVPLARRAAGLAAGPGPAGCRLALVAGTVEEAARKLARSAQKLQEEGRTQIQDKSGIFYFDQPLAQEGGLAFLFPGEGSQYLDMLADLCLHFPGVRACFDLLDRAYADHPRGLLPSQFIFPPPGSDRAQAEELLLAMDGAVDAVSTANRALAGLFAELGIAAQAMAGHSSGELAALEAAGAVPLAGEEDVIGYIRTGNAIIERLERAATVAAGRLLAVGGVERAAVDQVLAASPGFLVRAMDNCPHQSVLCGDEAVLAAAARTLRDKGAVCQPLPFHRPYHTERFLPALALLAELYDEARFQAPRVRLYSAMTAAPYPEDAQGVRDTALAQWAQPVRFRETVERMHDDGIRLFVEIGPRANLTSFVRDTLKGRRFAAVAANVHHRGGIAQLGHALALLAAHGVAMDLAPLFRRRVEKEILAMPAGGLEIRRELPILRLSGVSLAGARPDQGSPTTGEKAMPPTSDERPARPGLPPGADQVMDAYLASVEAILTTQFQVMTAYLAGGPLPAEAVAPPVPLPPRPAPAPTPDPAAERPEPRPVPAVPAGIEAMLFALVSDKTGYPQEILGRDQALEADLGIDSIKRVEILAALARQLGGLDEEKTAALTRLRTLGEIIDLLADGAKGERS
ncbi:MAG: beta-ketoacyl synthase N-terminal-like domain-containing protein [Thermodesulfobacteriota bacterium]